MLTWDVFIALEVSWQMSREGAIQEVEALVTASPLLQAVPDGVTHLGSGGDWLRRAVTPLPRSLLQHMCLEASSWLSRDYFGAGVLHGPSQNTTSRLSNQVRGWRAVDVTAKAEPETQRCQALQSQSDLLVLTQLDHLAGQMIVSIKQLAPHLGRLMNVWTSSLTIGALSHETHLNKGVSDNKGCIGKGYTMGLESPPPEHLPHKHINLIVPFRGTLHLCICNSSRIKVALLKLLPCGYYWASAKVQAVGLKKLL
ncbi:MAG: hypothetical protein FRX49_06660 [Trebouxia sp. A1-2]|nr:MAG: hypothetical protein FRX49_06660 [Trebouxia sp. A1-2]